MKIISKTIQAVFPLIAKLSRGWIRPSVLPDTPVKGAQSATLCYVIENRGLADRLALWNACRQKNLPHFLGVNCPSELHNGSVITLRRGKGLLLRRAHPQLEGLRNIIAANLAPGSSPESPLSSPPYVNSSNDICFVPVAIYWGRSPDKEHSVLKLFFSENWELVGRTRKLFTTLLHGRHTLVQFSEPVFLGELAKQDSEPPLVARKLSRVLRVHFRQRRIASLGPDQSHKRTIIDQVLADPSVQQAIKKIEQNSALSAKERRSAPKMARKYAFEIAADVSYPIIRFLQKLLAMLWNRLYDGIRFEGLDKLRAISDGKEIVYVPCHRSHIDYLLLSYALYTQGFSLPHIAAGLNLNMPVIGPILRRGGAFFLRRSTKDNRLYATVFNAYLQKMLSRGHAIEYFIEGGRSRSGRLRQPKAGLLAMTVQSYIKAPNRPLIFVPIYFGYERLIEGQSFISELSGANKKKESLSGLFSSLSALRQQYGEVYANIGEPISLDELLDQHKPNWRKQQAASDRPDWLPPIVDELGQTIMHRINDATAVTPVSLLALALLSTPKQNLSYLDLIRQLDLYLKLLKSQCQSTEIVVTEKTVEEIISHGESLGYICIESHPLGSIVQIKTGQAVSMTYFRNNILHLFALPSTVACCLINQSSLCKNEIKRVSAIGFPYIAKELFINAPKELLMGSLDQTIEQLVELGLVSLDKKGIVSRDTTEQGSAVRLMILGQALMPSYQRYYISSVLITKHPSGTLNQEQLERVCELTAERLAIEHGLHSPDFFERQLFKSFIQNLRDRKLLTIAEDNSIEYSKLLTNVESDARIILDEQVRHSIQSIATQASKLEQNDIPS